MKNITKSDLAKLNFYDTIYYFYQGEVTRYYYFGQQGNKVVVVDFYNTSIKYEFDVDFVCKWFHVDCSKKDILEYKYLSLKLKLNSIEREMIENGIFTTDIANIDLNF